MIGNIFKLGVIVKNTALWGSLATAAAYLFDKGLKEEDKIGAEKLVEGTLFPIAKNLGGTMLKGAQNIATGVSENETVLNGIRTATDLTSQGLVSAREAAPSVGSALYNGAGTVAGAGIAGVQAGYNGIYNFISEHILPKDASGWLKTLAAVSASVLALWGGSKAIGFSAGESFFSRIAGAPMRGLESVFGSLASGAATLVPLAVVAVGVGILLSPTAREWIGNAFGGTKDMIAGKGHDPASPAHGQALAAATSPVNSAPSASMSGLTDSIAFNSAITGGFDVNAANPVTLNQDPSHPVNRARTGTLDTSIAGRTA